MDIQPLDILKWIGIVLAAGFVGYFGRYLAMIVIDKVRKKKTRPAAEEPDVEATANKDYRLDESRLKLEKKKAKQEAKKAKKAGKK
jgi:hypothetical protein